MGKLMPSMTVDSLTRVLEEIANMPIGRNFQAEATRMRELARTATRHKTSTVLDWRSQGFYQSSSPCCVCGNIHQTGQEPRFGYVVCEQHSKLSPIEVNKQRIDGK